MASLVPLSGNDYRKRVLAPIEARGGMDATDPFEVYDIPLESAGEFTDAQVDAQLEQVWALWQKQRDHPKFRGLVTALLESHEHSREQLATALGRQQLATRAAAFRQERDGERFAQLDAAVRRLVDRFGGLPRGKVDGLRVLAIQSGIGAEDFEARIRRHRLIDDAPVAQPASVVDLSSVYRQVRADLEELGQLDSEAPPASLYTLIDLPAGAAPAQVRAQRDALAARNRERRPDRRRALIDDLLAAVTRLLVDGDPHAYLESLVSEVIDLLRPRVAAAILIEDTLTIADHELLLAAAQEAGLDQARAVRVLGELAREHGVSAPQPMTQPGPPPEPSSPVSAAAWQDELTRARAALRHGLLRSAARHVQAARSYAGQTLPPIRAIDDEVGRRIAEANQTWRAVARSLSSSLLSEAAVQLESLVSGASEILSPDGETAVVVLARVHDQLASIDRALAAAATLPGEQRELALLGLASSAPTHPAVVAALASIPPAAPGGVTARRMGGGVVVSWRASNSVGALTYRVLRREANGEVKALGGTAALSYETWAPDGPLPEFLVLTRRAGIESPPASTTGTPAVAPAPPVSASPTGAARAEPVTTLEIAPYRGRLRLIYPVPSAGRVEVIRLTTGTPAPAAGTAVADVANLGVSLAAMTPGLAMDVRPTQPITDYLAVTCEDGKISVAGASARFIAIPAMSGLAVVEDRLSWAWPSGCTEAVIVWRGDITPTGPDDVAAQRRKLTITRHEIDGGLLLPPQRPLHLAIFGCARVEGQLVTDPTVHPGACLTLA